MRIARTAAEEFDEDLLSSTSLTRILPADLPSPDDTGIEREAGFIDLSDATGEVPTIESRRLDVTGELPTIQAPRLDATRSTVTYRIPDESSDREATIQHEKLVRQLTHPDLGEILLVDHRRSGGVAPPEARQTHT